MKPEYINCSKCGTRNFADDDICGVCKSKLEFRESTQKINSMVNSKSNIKPILLLLLIVAIFYLMFIKANEDESTTNSIQKQELSLSSEVQLAIIQEHSKNPSASTVKQFSDLIKYFEKRYSHDKKDDIADALVSGYNISLKEFNFGGTLLEFSKEFQNYSIEVDKVYTKDMEESLALFIKVGFAKY